MFGCYGYEKYNDKHKYFSAKKKQIEINPISVKCEDFYSSNTKNEKLKQRETFCEGFFLSSIPYKDCKVLENSESFKASCGHQDCSSLPGIEPEIILRYPLEDTKTLILDDLLATICFPTGIKLCRYSEEGPTENIEEYGTWITNEKGYQLYMMTFHFYLKMFKDEFSKKYQIPKEYLSKVTQPLFPPNEKSKKSKNKLNLCKLINERYVYIPCCICLISKYHYEKQMKTCLESIYQLLIKNKEDKKENSKFDKLNYLIMYLIHSIPIPDVESDVTFYIPHNDPSKEMITLTYPKLEDFKAKGNLSELFELFSNHNIIRIFRLLLFGQKILFVDDDYARLSRITYYFKELLYPIKWEYQYIPIMSYQMIQYLQSIMPYLYGIDKALMDTAFNQSEENEIDDLFIIKIIPEKKSKIFYFKNGKLKEPKAKSLPSKLKDNLKNKLENIKTKVTKSVKNKQNKKNNNIDNIDNIHLEIRDCFIEIFVEMFHNIKKYVYLLDQEVVFNKKLFLEEVEKNEKIFYESLMQTQNFIYFIDNFQNEEYKYFRKKIENYNETTKIDLTLETFIELDVKKEYIINPYFLNVNENYIKDNNLRIVKNIQEIDSVIKNFKTEKFDIYLIPEKTGKLTKQEANPFEIPGENKGIINIENIDETKKENYEIHNSATILVSKEEMNEKEIKNTKSFIKNFMKKIFTSDESQMPQSYKKNVLDISCINNAQNLINTSVGRNYFISLLLENKYKVILLEEKFFDILGELIYNTLISLKVEAEKEKNIENMKQLIELIKSTKYFKKKEKAINSQKGKKTKKTKNFVPEKEISSLSDKYEEEIKKNIGDIYDNKFWYYLYTILLEKEEKVEKKDEVRNEVKKRVILKIYDLMKESHFDEYYIFTVTKFLDKK